MTEALIWANYLMAAALSLWCAARIDLSRLTFADGLLAGMIYYLVLPMFFILVDGRISAQFVRAEDYLPYRDLDTTLTIIVCLYFVCLLQLALPRPARRPATMATGRVEGTLLGLVAATYFASTAASFVLAGLWAGGHWHANVQEALSTSGVALVLRHLAGFSRTAIFGLLLYQAWTGGLSRRWFYVLGAAVVACDMLLTFNRITAAYFLVAVVLLQRERKWAVGALLGLVVFVLPAISNMWPVFRGLATRDGYTLEGVFAAAEAAYRTAVLQPGLADFTSGVFESINIPVLNYVVQHQGHVLEVSPLSTYVRPATIFLPSMMWEERPQVFGAILGSAINNSTNGLALNSTLIGEPYANFGAWWPVGVLPIYLLYHTLFLLLARASASMGAIGAFCAFAMWRFDGTVAAVALVLCVVLLCLARVRVSARPAGLAAGAAG